jgi:phosphopantothenoylcysteine decarboxylase/phosphopantothenate--cysteine ligase
MLKNKKIILGVTGGIAAYKSIELMRELQKSGAEVRVVMTHAATEMVGELTFKALSHHVVLTPKLATSESYFTHIEWARWADLILVAPCTANSLGNFANGITPDILSLIWMSSRAQKMIIPTMNSVMLSSVAVQKNIEFLKFSGTAIMNPESGVLACGEVGEGRFPEIQKIVDEVQNVLFPAGQKCVVISAGRTEEYFDAVRYISNLSSGKTALELVREFKKNNWKVCVVSGPTQVQWPSWVELKNVVSAQEMYDEMMKYQSEEKQKVDAFVLCAAVADFRPLAKHQSKLKQSAEILSLELVANPDILQSIANQKKSHQVVVGFALETENIELHAQQKIQKKKCDLLLVNNPVAHDSGFGFDSVDYALIDSPESTVNLKRGTKSDLAFDLVLAIQKKQEI